MAAQQIGDRRSLAVIADASRQGEVKAPLLEHIGITPARQQLFLARRQDGRAAALDKLRTRLNARGRETAAAAANRLARSDAYSVNDTRLVTIVNDGALDAAAEAFVRLLATLRYSPGVHRRA